MATQALLALAGGLHHAATLAAAMAMALVAITAATRYRRAWLAVPLADAAGLEIVGYALPDRQLVAQRMAAVDIAKDAHLTDALTLPEPFVIPDMRLEPRADQAQVEFFRQPHHRQRADDAARGRAVRRVHGRHLRRRGRHAADPRRVRRHRPGGRSMPCPARPSSR